MEGFNYEKDSDGVVTITMDMPGQAVNTVNSVYQQLMDDVMAKLEGDIGNVKGAIFTSGKDTFFAGGDLNDILSVERGDEKRIFDWIETIKGSFRRLEKYPRPVVAAINGAALGGGYELCLACNHRIVLNEKSAVVGLPEVSLGLLPGSGGIVRLVRLIGLERALPLLLEGKPMKPEAALASGMVDNIVDTHQELIAASKRWIVDGGNAKQAWDLRSYRFPNGGPENSNPLKLAMVGPATLRKRSRGLLPAPEKILSVAVESMRVDFETALRIESRALVELALTPVAKNLMSTMFFQLNSIKAGGNRPSDFEKFEYQKIAVLGAGMMGQGIAYSAARAGISVILKDVNIDVAQSAKIHAAELLEVEKKRGKMGEKEAQEILERIVVTDDIHQLQGSDLVLETVFEDIEIKAGVTKATEGSLNKNGIFASNTSALPITTLAQAASDPSRFIGMHFFSPVNKMPLVEIIVGEATSDETLAKAIDFVHQIRKIPIVVNDARGFYTSRVFGTFIDEGCRLLDEGLDPAIIENLAKQAGMPVGPLAINDEVSMVLTSKNADSLANLKEEFTRGVMVESIAVGAKVANRMVKDLQRGGKKYGGGFYEYPEGDKKYLWPGLYMEFYKKEIEYPTQDVIDRFLFRQIIEALHAYEEGVLRSIPDGNIGSIMGIGFPAHTGGVFQYINTYGVEQFYKRCEQLAGSYGTRFTPPDMLLKYTDAGKVLD